MNELFDVKEKVIVVTGATGILAGGAAKYLQKNGATVVYLGRNQERVDNALTEAKSISDACMGLTSDVLDEESLSKGYEEVISKFGRIDALINGAGEICLVLQSVQTRKYSILILMIIQR